MKIAVIVQARMSSTRLPGKVMKDLFGKTVLAHDIERIKQIKDIDEIVIATTSKEEDTAIVEEALANGVSVFRGSQEDVLSRYYLAAKKVNADVIIRITSDCPLIDPKIVDDMIRCFKSGNYEILTNGGMDLTKKTFPLGLGTEIFTFRALEKAYKKACEPYQKEHVTPYIYENSDSIYYYMNNEDYSYYRWTLDTEEDWELIEKIYMELYRGKHDFYFKDVLEVMINNPKYFDINKDIKQKKVK